MEIPRDFSELLALFNARGVEYVIVGAHALAFHGAPRATGDLDLLVKTDPANARRIMGALEVFGFGSVGITASDFETPGLVVQLGITPVRVDLVTSLSGVTWDEVVAGRVAGKLGGVPVSFIGREHFIANKRASGRARDLADVEALGEA